MVVLKLDKSWQSSWDVKGTINIFLQDFVESHVCVGSDDLNWRIYQAQARPKLGLKTMSKWSRSQDSVAWWLLSYWVGRSLHWSYFFGFRLHPSSYPVSHRCVTCGGNLGAFHADWSNYSTLRILATVQIGRVRVRGRPWKNGTVHDVPTRISLLKTILVRARWAIFSDSTIKCFLGLLCWLVVWVACLEF